MNKCSKIPMDHLKNKLPTTLRNCLSLLKTSVISSDTFLPLQSEESTLHYYGRRSCQYEFQIFFIIKLCI